MRAPLFKQMAQSTAFRIPDYDLVQNPKNYSLWTESGMLKNHYIGLNRFYRMGIFDTIPHLLGGITGKTKCFTFTWHYFTFLCIPNCLDHEMEGESLFPEFNLTY